MSGRKRRVSLDTLHDKFEENEDKIVRDNKVVAPSNIIWETINVQVGRKSTKKAIYNDALKWFKSKQTLKIDESSEIGDFSDVSV